MSKIYKIGYVLLMTFIIVIGGLLVFSMIPIKGNFQIKIVLSGSMQPTIKTGSVVVVKPADKYEVGDIVTFGKDDRDNVPTTHRIVGSRAVEGVLLFTTKGDANEDNDPREVKEGDIVGKVLFDVPYFGFILDMARKPLGFAVLIGIPAIVIVYDEGAKILREVKKMRKPKPAVGQGLPLAEQVGQGKKEEDPIRADGLPEKDTTSNGAGKKET